MSLTTKKIQIGDQVFEASAVVFMDERDGTLKAMSECRPCVLLTILIPFKDSDAVQKIQRVIEEGMDPGRAQTGNGSAETHLPYVAAIANAGGCLGNCGEGTCSAFAFKEGRRVPEFQEVTCSESPIDRHRR
jgi:hypothetical protein